MFNPFESPTKAIVGIRIMLLMTFLGSFQTMLLMVGVAFAYYEDFSMLENIFNIGVPAIGLMLNTYWIHGILKAGEIE